MRLLGPGAAHVCALVAVLLIAGPAPLARAQSSGGISGSVRVLKKGGQSAYDSHADAVVWVSGVSTPAPATQVTVSQLNKKFRPRVLPVVKGQVVNFLNQDKIEHNVFSTTSHSAFDLGRYPKGESRSVRFDQLGGARVYCNIHKAMLLDIVVVDNEYFAVTDEEGVFAIEGVPRGRYQLNVWHIYGGTHSQEVQVSGSIVALEPITVTSTKVVRQVTDHLNKHGKHYKKKPFGGKY